MPKLTQKAIFDFVKKIRSISGEGLPIKKKPRPVIKAFVVGGTLGGLGGMGLASLMRTSNQPTPYYPYNFQKTSDLLCVSAGHLVEPLV